MSDERRRTRRSYRPGEWYAVFGDRATVLLPPTQRSRAAQLWPLLDDGAGFDEVLDALIATGLRGLPGFVLVSESDDQTRIVLRGAARAVLAGADGDVELEGSAATTWVERSVRGVTRLVVEVGPGDAHEEADDDGAAAEPLLCTDGGVARVRRVDQPPYQPPEAAPAPVEVEPATAPEPVPDPERAAAWSPAPVPPPAYDDAPTEAIRPSDFDDDGGTDEADADRVTDRFPEHDRGDDRPVARLAFSSGEVVDVDRVVLVGRAPQARRIPTAEQPRLVTVPSPHQEVSATHLEVRPGTGPDRGVAVVTDLGSTNGTVLLEPGEEALDLRAGLGVRLVPGAVLDLGDGVTIRVSDV